MTVEAVYQAVRTFLEDNWDTDKAALTWENEPFQPPSGEPWIFVEMDDSDYEQMSLGSGAPALELWRETGAVLFRVNVPINSGVVKAGELISDLRALMRGVYLPDNTIFTSMPTAGRGAGDDGNWYGFFLRVLWTRDDPVM